MIKLNAIAILLIVFCINCNTKDKDTTLSNSHLEVKYNPEIKELTVLSKLDNFQFVKHLIPSQATSKYKKTKVTDAVFGNGEMLAISTVNGGEITFTLYKNEAFLFVTETILNTSNTSQIINKTNPLLFTVDLNIPISEVKTLGTGGLLNPDENPGSYVFLTTVNPKNRNGVVAGWLTHDKGSGVLFSDVNENQLTITPQIDYGQLLLAPNAREKTETLIIGYFNDARIGEEQFATTIAKHYDIKMRERSAVYCSWYSEKNGGAGSEASTIELASFIKEHLKDYGLGVIQLDDQWQDGGSYNGPARGFDRTRKIPLKTNMVNGTSIDGFPANYPDGMEKTTKAIHAANLQAGIWWMPFSRNHQDPEYANKQDWFAYRNNGTPYETPWGGTSLDLTNPKVQEHVASVAKTMQSWGFDYFKMDGLWTGTVTEQVYINDGYKNDSIGNCKPLFNPEITQIEAFRNGLKTLRNATHNQVFFSGCCISQNMRSFGASIGLVDAMRVGPDFNHDGESMRTGAIRASRLYFLNGRVWWNDPDPSMLREKGDSTADPSAKGIGSLVRARLLPSYVALSNQFFLSSDWLPDLPQERLDIMKRCMLSHNGIARPVDAFDTNLPGLWLAQKEVNQVNRNVLGFFNWALENKTMNTSLSWAGLEDQKDYYAFDFWDNTILGTLNTNVSFELIAESCKIIALRAKENHPVVVSTSQHISQGMVDILSESWEQNKLSGSSKIVANDPYEIRVAGLNDGAKRTLENAIIVNNPKVKITVLPATDSNWLRIVIQSPETQTVNWQLTFKS